MWFIHIYNGILLSHKKERNWVICREVDGSRDCHTEWSKSERGKQTSYINAYMRNLEKWYRWTGVQGRNRDRGGLPGGAVVENLPANAGDTGSSPGLGRSHMPRSNWAREPQLLSLRVWSLCSATREAATVRGPCTAMKSGPRLPQLEKALAQKRRPNTAKNK